MHHGLHTVTEAPGTEIADVRSSGRECLRRDTRGGFSLRPSFGSGNVLRDDLAGGGFKLSAPVGPGAPNRPRDVFQVESVLNGSGLLSRAPGTEFGEDTASAIGQGQQRLNRDHKNTVGRRPLKIDSLINPDGPILTASRPWLNFRWCATISPKSQHPIRSGRWTGPVWVAIRFRLRLFPKTVCCRLSSNS